MSLYASKLIIIPIITNIRIIKFVKSYISLCSFAFYFIDNNTSFSRFHLGNIGNSCNRSEVLVFPKFSSLAPGISASNSRKKRQLETKSLGVGPSFMMQFNLVIGCQESAGNNDFGISDADENTDNVVGSVLLIKKYIITSFVCNSYCYVCSILLHRFNISSIKSIKRQESFEQCIYLSLLAIAIIYKLSWIFSYRISLS